MLELLADANFDLLAVGIETPNQESLKETGKFQNIRKDLLADVHKILSYGIGVRAGIIVGFDHDGPDIFDIQYKFIQDACLPLASISMLKAPIGTRLWTRLSKEGRMLNWSKLTERTTKHNRMTNIIPNRLTRADLMRGMCDLQQRVHSWENFAERVKKMVLLVKRRPNVQDDPMPLSELLALGSRLEVDPEGCRVIEDIFLHVAKVAPFMWRKVRSYIGSLAIYGRSLPGVLKALEEQIAMEESGEVQIELEERDLDIPQVFRDKFKVIFPKVYRCAHLNLDDKSKLDEVLMDIFVDFVVHWGKNLEEFDDYHLELLYELTNRACARANGQAPELFVPRVSEDMLAEKPPRFFDQEVLKSVGQELIMIAYGEKGLGNGREQEGRNS